MNEHVDQVEEVVECRIFKVYRDLIYRYKTEPINIKIKKHNFRMLLWSSCHTEVDWTA